MPEKNIGNQALEQPGNVKNKLPGFTLFGGQIKGEIHKPNLVQIKKAIDALDTDIDDPFLILETSIPINGSNCLQIYKWIRSKDGKVSYTTEFEFDFINSSLKWRQYQKEIQNVSEVKRLFENYFINRETPDISDWNEIYQKIIDKLKNKKISEAYFNIEDTCSMSVRKNDNLIFKGHGIKHGSIINGKTIYQPMGEALTLLADIINSEGKYGDIYYSTDKKRFYCDILFPKEWPGQNSNIPEFRAYHIRDKISIAALNKESKQVFLKIKPLKTANRLLPCLLLLIIEKLLCNETYLETAIYYFLYSNYSNFIALYELVFNYFPFKKYRIIDNYDDEEDDNKFDLSDYLSFTSMCRIIMENKKIYNKSV